MPQSERAPLPGGGVALLCARAKVSALHGDNSEQEACIQIVLRALEIVASAGGEPPVVLSKVLEGKGSFGYNAATGEYGYLIEMDVLDPAKVTRCALQNAASIARLIPTMDAMVSYLPKNGGKPGAMDEMEMWQTIL